MIASEGVALNHVSYPDVPCPNSGHFLYSAGRVRALDISDVLENVGGKSIVRGKTRFLVIPQSIVRIAAYGVAAIVATLVLGTLSSRLISWDEPTTVLLFGVVIGVINAFIKPVVRFISMPITCLTFGLFALVVNAALFYVGASLTPGMEISAWGALSGSILASLTGGLMFSVVDE